MVSVQIVVDLAAFIFVEHTSSKLVITDDLVSKGRVLRWVDRSLPIGEWLRNLCYKQPLVSDDLVVEVSKAMDPFYLQACEHWHFELWENLVHQQLSDKLFVGIFFVFHFIK